MSTPVPSQVNQSSRVPGALEERVGLAQSGDTQEQNDLIRDFQPFIMRVAAQVSRRYVNASRDEEASVALIAFNEAIQSFRTSGGASFLTFAEMVIRRRLIDFYRRASHRYKEIPLSRFEEAAASDEEQASLDYIQLQEAHRTYEAEIESRERRDEIARLGRVLDAFGIQFSDLVRHSPKHKDARERAFKVGRAVAGRPEWRRLLFSRKMLPLKELAAELGMSRKTLERHRRYIVAVSLILLGEYPHLQQYVEPAEPRALKPVKGLGRRDS